jgi:RNA polymerase sigma factor (sigma-70 family)
LLEVFNVRNDRDGRAERAFAALVQRHGAMVLSVCRQLLGDEHAAEDAFQATFLVLARKAGSIRRPELLGHWLYGVAVRTARKAKRLRARQHRREGQEVSMLSAEPTGVETPNEVRLSRREEAEALHQEVSRLPEKYRLPIVLCYLEGLTHAEAARRLRWPVGTFSVRLMRARDLLRARLSRRGLAPTASLLVVPVGSETASTAVPPELLEATVRSAVQLAAGQALSSGIVSTSVALLVKKVLIGMVPGESIAMGVMTTLMAGVIVTGVASLAPKATATGDQTPAPESVAQAAPTSPPVLDHQTRPGTQESRQADRDASAEVVPASVPETVTPETPAEPSGDAKTYRRLAAGVGRSPDAQVRLALWCEAHGLIPERLKHLSLAVLLDPTHATARGLLGLVAYRGHWQGTEAIAARVRDDADLTAILAEYNLRRQKAPRTADAQWKLALWCEQKGLKAEATAHLVAVTRLDPDHEGAWKRLGCKRYNGRWLTEEQAAAERAEAEAQKDANRRWKPLLTKWRGWLADKDLRQQAGRKLAAVADPYAVPSVWAVFAIGGANDQERAVQLFGQIDAPAATRMLALLAVFSPSAEVHRKATETLARRDPRDALSLLIGLLRDPDPNPNTVLVRFEVVPSGALGVGSPGFTFIEGRYANLLRFYPSLSPWRRSPFPATSLPTTNTIYEERVVAQRSALAHAAQVRELDAIVSGLLAAEVREFGQISAAIRRLNSRVIDILRTIAGDDRGDDWEAWTRWWVEELGYAYNPNQFRNPPDRAIDLPKPTYVTGLHHSCFAAGTPVRTLTGPRPIESIRPGDQVLTQDVGTGALRFAPVLAAIQNRPTRTLRIDLEGEPIVATGIHRFWKVGQGWVMARDLKPGDAVRTLGGQARVDAVSADQVQPVFNLEVGEAQSFFVGRSGILVHDNSQVQPVVAPFDALAESSAVPRAHRDPGRTRRDPFDPVNPTADQ